jgi:hypothetical protein
MKQKSIEMAGDFYKNVKFSEAEKQRFVDQTEAKLRSYQMTNGSFNLRKLKEDNEADVS